MEGNAGEVFDGMLHWASEQAMMMLMLEVVETKVRKSNSVFR